MKRLFFICCLIIVCAQGAFSKQFQPAFKNALKYEVLNSIYGDYSITYERLIKNRTALNFRIGYLNLYDFATGNEYFTIDWKSTGFNTSLEYRYFLSEKNGIMGEGFYVGGYARYVEFSLGEISSQEVPFSIRSDLSYAGVGLHFGIQQSLRKLIHTNSDVTEQLKRIVFDFHIVGFGLDYYTLKFSLRDVNPDTYADSEFAKLLDLVYEKYPKLPTIDYSLLNRSKPVKTPFLWPGIKVGFSVGYKF